MSKQYGERFKARVVSRMAGAEGVSATSLSRELGVPQPTLSRWLREARNVAAVHDEDEKAPRRPEDWSPREKLEAVLEAGRQSEAELGKWLRLRGLTEGHVHQWRAALEERADDVFAGRKEPRQSPAVSKREKALERELARKEKALAEAAALLVLRGKLEALWAGEDVSTRQKSDAPSSKPSTKRGKRGRD